VGSAGMRQFHDCYLDVEGMREILATSRSGMTCAVSFFQRSYGLPARAACEEAMRERALGFSKCVQTAREGGCKKIRNS